MTSVADQPVEPVVDLAVEVNVEKSSPVQIAIEETPAPAVES